MKTKCFILLSSLVLVCLFSCQKLTEDPKGKLTPVTYFRSQKDLDGAVAACYECYAHDYGYGFTTRMNICFGSDDLATHWASSRITMRLSDELNSNATDGGSNACWNPFWTGIYQANNVIVNFAKVPTTDDLKNGAAAQAYFLRACAYYMLVRSFGPVPLVLGASDVSVKLPRAAVSDVYASIVSDLQTAINLFPASYTITPDKVNPMSAQALLADVYLTMTGWPINDATKYADAATAANVVIQANKYTLVPDYLTMFSLNNHSESIWALQFNKGNGTAQRGYGQSSIVDDEVGLDGSSGWDDFFPEVNFFLAAPKCLRTDETFVTTIKLRNADKVTYNLVPWNSPLTDVRHPEYKKFRYGVGVPGNGDGCVETATTIVTMNASTNKANDIIRYPMVLLDYAEASAMDAGAPTAASYSAINIVRARAGEAPLTAGLSATAFRDSVVYERAYEFCGENGMRWFDVQRLQLLPKIVAARSTGFIGYRSIENPIPDFILFHLADRYLAPIPWSDMYLNPTWKQNPGY
jgi:starch-binding outer membrane protein, SusD/RagB family